MNLPLQKKRHMFCWWCSHMSAERLWESVPDSGSRTPVPVARRTSRRAVCLSSCSLPLEEALGTPRVTFCFVSQEEDQQAKSFQPSAEVRYIRICSVAHWAVAVCLICKAVKGWTILSEGHIFRQFCSLWTFVNFRCLISKWLSFECNWAASRPKKAFLLHR